MVTLIVVVLGFSRHLSLTVIILFGVMTYHDILSLLETPPLSGELRLVSGVSVKSLAMICFT